MSVFWIFAVRDNQMNPVVAHQHRDSWWYLKCRAAFCLGLQ